MNRHVTRREPPGHFHAVRFYESKASLCRTVADFLGEGLAVGELGLVIATPVHQDALLLELKSRHFDVDEAVAAGNLLLLDARDLLGRFMADGKPDSDRFSAEVHGALDRLARGRTGIPVRAYGEMVDVLWQDGFTAAAIRLEMLWNQLATTREFSLLCGYAIGSFYKDAGMRDICAQHSHTLAADSALERRTHRAS